jgi:hypothetical protein
MLAAVIGAVERVRPPVTIDGWYGASGVVRSQHVRSWNWMLGERVKRSSLPLVDPTSEHNLLKSVSYVHEPVMRTSAAPGTNQPTSALQHFRQLSEALLTSQDTAEAAHRPSGRTQSGLSAAEGADGALRGRCARANLGARRTSISIVKKCNTRVLQKMAKNSARSLLLKARSLDRARHRRRFC